MIKWIRDDGGVDVVTLDRPEKRNAMTPHMFEELRVVIMGERAAGRSALVLGGEGPVFCGGFDLKLCHEQPGTMRTLLVELSAAVAELRALDVPVVVAAQGAAIAGGCALLGAADYVVTNDDAKLGYPVVKLGVSPAVSAPFFRQMVGDGRCRERMLDTELISGREAVRIGLASESVAKAEQVMDRAKAVARDLATKPGIGFGATKRWLRELEGVNAGSSLAASLSVEGHAEERERLKAMFEGGR